MKIAITGGTGFVGSHLARSLVTAGHEVVIIARGIDDRNSNAQVRILSEGLVDPAPPCDPLPLDLAPALPFTEDQIVRGLPPAGPFRVADLRCSLPALGPR